ncbi:hypothetical protein A8144_04395 [Mycobacterium leprae 3125609]|uniref:B1549_C1_174 n=1 Tax=Mycobacterium leprae TaxID=1769 RepID=Q49711_MYCLR|nr:B1549_C1_174 [Mycobacterium leprae]OAR19668.1 hypothetical protein A8144_04395 [Mycobacterium leprae 3125609]OAX71824.1 hypothetical protein A3216_03275 [Mycobacterium leprae 7935681]
MARKLVVYCQRVEEVWPMIDITYVDGTVLPDNPVLGSKLTLTATVQLAGLGPDEVTVQAVLGRVGGSDMVIDQVNIEMTYIYTAEGGNEIFSTTTLLPLRGVGVSDTRCESCLAIRCLRPVTSWVWPSYF